MFEGIDYRQQFFVMDLVVYFRWLELSGVKRHWV